MCYGKDFKYHVNKLIKLDMEITYGLCFQQLVYSTNLLNIYSSFVNVRNDLSKVNLTINYPRKKFFTIQTISKRTISSMSPICHSREEAMLLFTTKLHLDHVNSTII